MLLEEPYFSPPTIPPSAMSPLTLCTLLLSTLLLSSFTFSLESDAPIFAPIFPSGDSLSPLLDSTRMLVEVSAIDSPFDDEFLPSTLPPHAIAAVDAVVEPYPAPSNSSTHAFHPMQSSDVVFTMELMTNTAPWSARIQPALLYQQTPVFYRNAQSNVQVSTGDHWLLLFEGSLSRIGVNDSDYANENDVWASMDDGQTWDLIAGISRFGTSGVVNSRSPNTFPARGGSSNCEDPASDRIYSIAGYRYNISGGVNRGMYGTTQVYTSTDGKQWPQFGNAATWPQPNRFFSSCDVDINGHVFSMGGVTIAANGQQSLLNDVWNTASGGWTRVCANAPWAARAEHLTLIASNTPIGREIIYVIGGSTGWLNNGGVQTNSNDVWASSDQGVTWRQLVANNAFGHFFHRWGHAGVITDAGVIILFGGSNSPDGSYANTYSYRDVWTSYDGGFTWRTCNMPGGPTGPDAAKQFIRTEQGVTINREGKMIIATGYSFDPNNPIVNQRRFDYRDVWRTPFSVEDTSNIAAMCGGTQAIPRAGLGMRAWPTVPNPSPETKMIMHALTHRAPWSPRRQPGFLVMDKPITYVQNKTGLTVSTPPGWLLLYEGSVPGAGFVAENDVWASADNGASWDLISGISRFGSGGLQGAYVSTRSFVARADSSQCEDPTSDDVFSLGGTIAGVGASNTVYYSSDAVHWTVRTGTRSFTPPRTWTSCDIDDHGVMYVMGGMVPPTTQGGQNRLLNDVWWGTNRGSSWQRVSTDDVELEGGRWSARAEHSVLLYHSSHLKTDLLYVIGGWTLYQPPVVQAINDVWVSSDGGLSWVELTGLYTEEGPHENVFSRRWGQAAVITEKGVLLVIGGADSRNNRLDTTVSHKDIWASFDGGINCTTHNTHSTRTHPVPLVCAAGSPPWLCDACVCACVGHPCQLPQGGVDYIRTDMSAQLTPDEHLLLASGFQFSNGSRRIDFSDVHISNISLSDPAALSVICGGEDKLPRGGVGLRVWPGSGDVVLTRGGMSGVAISGIAISIFLIVAVLAYCVNGYQRSGRWPIPAFLGGTPIAHYTLDTGSTDYSQFAFGDKTQDAGAGAATNGGTNGTKVEHAHDNSQFLS